MRDRLTKLLPDLLLVMGAGAVTYGCWLAYAPAGYVIGGALAVAQGLALARAHA
jgi:hypothetical protein